MRPPAEPVDPAVVTAVAEQAAKAGLKHDVPESRIVRAVRTVAAAHGVGTAAVARPPLLDEAMESLAVHESWFFRDPRQLTALAKEIVPTLTPPVRLWSAGCGNGQEAWSLAMLLAEAMPGGQWEIVASDLSAAAVERARRGVYRSAELRGLSTERRARFVQPLGEGWVIADELRPRVSFVRSNIATQPPPLSEASCDVVLCRNVLIYLHPDAVAAALSSIERTMSTGGWLLLGSAESLFGITERFTATPLRGAFAYRRAGAASASASAPAPVRTASGTGSGSSRRPRPVVEPVPAVDDLLAQARRAAEAGEHEDAARAFRQAAYLDPERGEAHAGLAAALDAAGDRRGAARARAVARRLGP